jgi:hypothetical protein
MNRSCSKIERGGPDQDHLFFGGRGIIKTSFKFVTSEHAARDFPAAKYFIILA